MASLPFSATCSHSTFIGFDHNRARNSNLCFIRNSRFTFSRRNFFIKSVASDQKQDLKEAQVTEEGYSKLLKPMVLFQFSFGKSCYRIYADSLHTFVPDSASIASSIKYHAEFTPSFSPDSFELPKAFYATAESVRDSLIINWNATYEYYEKINVKQAYYLSMEFLQV